MVHALANQAGSQDGFGKTALMLACGRFNFQVAQMLFERERNVKDKNGATALSTALKSSPQTSQERQGHTKIVEMLAFQSQQYDPNGRTALMHACSEFHLHVV